MGKKKVEVQEAPQKKFADMTDAEKVQYKRDAFVRLVKPRVDKLCKAAEQVRQCASINYISTDAQKKAVVEACRVAFEGIERAYSGGGTVSGGFQLPQG